MANRRVIAPSSTRTFEVMRWAMNSRTPGDTTSEGLVRRAWSIFCLQDAKAQFVVGRVQVDDKAALEARLDAFLMSLISPGARSADRTICLFLVHQRVEGVEEFFCVESLPAMNCRSSTIRTSTNGTVP